VGQRLRRALRAWWSPEATDMLICRCMPGVPSPTAELSGSTWTALLLGSAHPERYTLSRAGPPATEDF
ncbi:MAG: hypothetical protein ACRDUV_04595, partial [Pseudonocardiaceae bacterium]